MSETMACCRCSIPGTLLYGRGSVSGRAPKDLGRRAAALRAQSLEEIDRTYFALPGALFRDRDDPADARRDEDALPKAFLPGAERSAHFRVHLRYVDARGIERAQRQRVTLLEQRNQQMFRSNVVMAMVAALLLC